MGPWETLLNRFQILDRHTACMARPRRPLSRASPGWELAERLLGDAAYSPTADDKENQVPAPRNGAAKTNTWPKSVKKGILKRTDRQDNACRNDRALTWALDDLPSASPYVGCKTITLRLSDLQITSERLTKNARAHSDPPPVPTRMSRNRLCSNDATGLQEERASGVCKPPWTHECMHGQLTTPTPGSFEVSRSTSQGNETLESLHNVHAHDAQDPPLRSSSGTLSQLEREIGAHLPQEAMAGILSKKANPEAGFEGWDLRSLADTDLSALLVAANDLYGAQGLHARVLFTLLPT
jgi:hypothetical protein